MPTELPHFLRFARALALVSGVAVTGCGATVASQDVPPTDNAVPSDGVVVAPDRPMVDAGIVIAPDTGSPPGISAPPDGATPDTGPPPGIVAPPDAGVSDAPERPDTILVGVVVAPDATADDDVIRDGIAPAPDAGVRDATFGLEGGPQVAPELPWA